MAAERPRPPLVVLALDAVDGDLIEQWAAEGHLPAIARILRQGCRGRPGGPETVSEHGIWLSLWSGVSRARHGYYHWRPLRPGTYDLHLSDLSEVTVAPFWNVAPGQRLKVLSVDAHEIRPSPGLPGVQLANWAPHNPRFATLAEPQGLLRDLLRRFGSPTQVEEKTATSPEEDRDIHGRLLRRIEEKGALCRELLGRDRFDVVVVGFTEPHIAGHQFWPYRGPGGAHEATLEHAVRDVYRAIDRELDRLLALLPPDANVVILSNMGMQGDYPNLALTDAFCRDLGYRVPAAAAGPSRRPLDRVRRALPERWRLAASRLLSRESRERLLSDRFRHDTDWNRTSVFSIPSFYMGFLRVNLRGREPQGIVEPGAEYDATLDRLAADLRALVDPETARPAVGRIVSTSATFGGGAPQSLPDLFFEWEPTPHFKRRVVHTRVVLEQAEGEFHRGTRHSSTGFVAAAGPAVRRHGELHGVSVLDVAPTLLALLGQPIPEDLAGRPVSGLVGR